MCKKLMNKAGYISVETVVIAGLMLALGAFIITALFDKAQEVNDSAMTNIDGVLAVTDSLAGQIGG